MRAEVDTSVLGRSAARRHGGEVLDERDLVRRARAGERAPFAALVGLYCGSLLRFARLVFRDEASAREAVQDTWAALVGGVADLEEHVPLKACLFRILVNRAKRRPMRSPARWTRETPADLALQRETRAVIEDAVAELPLAQRAVLVLRDVEGLETDDIRDLLDIAVTEQRLLLHRARAHVARALEAHARRGRPARSSGPRGGSEEASAAPSTEGS
jgi:RNA polymerase sigma-70 factor (ECF subfamily)